MRCVVLSSLGLMLAMLPLAFAAGASGKTVVSLGTATPGGGFPVYGDAVTATINEIDADARGRSRRTPRAAPRTFRCWRPASSTSRWCRARPRSRPRTASAGRRPTCASAAMYATPGMFVVRADSPYRSIDDLKGKPVAFGAKGSGLVLLARYVLDGLGLDLDRDFEAVLPRPRRRRARDGARRPGGGAVGRRHGLARLHRRGQGRRRALHRARTRTGIRRIQAKHPSLKTLTVPPNSYPGQTEPIISVGSWSFILARPTLPDDVAYRLARALHKGEADIAARLPQARETHGRQHRRRGRPPRPDPPRRAQISGRDRARCAEGLDHVGHARQLPLTNRRDVRR